MGPRRRAASARVGVAPVGQRRQRDRPLSDVLQRATARDDGDVGHRGRGHTPVAELPGRPAYSEEVTGDDPYARRLRRLARDQRGRRSGRLHTNWDELELLPTPRGTRTTFLLDRAIGYQASGVSMAMFELGPGRGQSMHRHAGEAWLYVLEGTGHSYLGTEPEGGTNHPWKKGDLIVVDHFLWHQHFNDDPEKTAKVVQNPHVRQPARHHAGADGSHGALRGAAAAHPRRTGRRYHHGDMAGGHQADVAVTAAALPPGLLSVQCCPRITMTDRGTTSSPRRAPRSACSTTRC